MSYRSAGFPVKSQSHVFSPKVSRCFAPLDKFWNSFFKIKWPRLLQIFSFEQCCTTFSGKKTRKGTSVFWTQTVKIFCLILWFSNYFVWVFSAAQSAGFFCLELFFEVKSAKLRKLCFAVFNCFEVNPREVLFFLARSAVFWSKNRWSCGVFWVEFKT